MTDFEMDANQSPMLLKRGEALRLCKSTADIDVVISLSKHSDPLVRKAALKEMCPCRVKIDIEDFWDRVLAMVDDCDDDVRQQVKLTMLRRHPFSMLYLSGCFPLLYTQSCYFSVDHFL